MLQQQVLDVDLDADVPRMDDLVNIDLLKRPRILQFPLFHLTRRQLPQFISDLHYNIYTRIRRQN